MYGEEIEDIQLEEIQAEEKKETRGRKKKEDQAEEIKTVCESCEFKKGARVCSSCVELRKE